MHHYKYHIQQKRIIGDLHSPVSIYLKLRSLYPQSVLLESSDYYAKDNSFSYIGIAPLASIEIKEKKAICKYPSQEKTVQFIDKENTIEEIISSFINCFKIDNHNLNFCGFYGYTAYDCIQYTENITLKNKDKSTSDLYYILYKYLIRFDPLKKEILLIELLQQNEKQQLNQLINLLKNKNYQTFDFQTKEKITSLLTDEEHSKIIEKGIQYCLEGNFKQIVLSRSYIQPYQGDDFMVYRALRSINPSPYLFYFDFGSYRIFGSSPETHCRITKNEAFIDPIAGTAKRTRNSISDKKQIEKLLADPKENAEHMMLVELAKNDLNKNCQKVKVEFLKKAQLYSHVIHLVSRIKGKVLTKQPIKIFLDTFPAGTLTGFPKIEAMRLISTIESTNRGVYGGCIGYIGLNGELNQAIAIRTFVSENNLLTFQAGGGILTNSIIEKEVNEVKNKLEALKQAIKLAKKIED